MSYKEDAWFSKTTFVTDEQGHFVEPRHPVTLKLMIAAKEVDNTATNDRKLGWKNELVATLKELGYSEIPSEEEKSGLINIRSIEFQAKFTLLCYTKRLRFSESLKGKHRTYRVKKALRETYLPKLESERARFESELQDSKEKDRILNEFDTLINQYKTFKTFSALQDHRGENHKRQTDGATHGSQSSSNARRQLEASPEQREGIPNRSMPESSAGKHNQQQPRQLQPKPHADNSKHSPKSNSSPRATSSATGRTSQSIHSTHENRAGKSIRIRTGPDSDSGESDKDFADIARREGDRSIGLHDPANWVERALKESNTK